MGTLDSDEYQYTVPDILLNPPKKYDRITNKIGVCGKKPNLVFGGTPRRIWVLHAVNGVESKGGVLEYVEAYSVSYDPETGERELVYSPDTIEEFVRAVEQALEFYSEYKNEFDLVAEKREEIIEKIKEESDTVTPPADDAIS